MTKRLTDIARKILNAFNCKYLGFKELTYYISLMLLDAIKYNVMQLKPRNE